MKPNCSYWFVWCAETPNETQCWLSGESTDCWIVWVNFKAVKSVNLYALIIYVSKNNPRQQWKPITFITQALATIKTENRGMCCDEFQLNCASAFSSNVHQYSWWKTVLCIVCSGKSIETKCTLWPASSKRATLLQHFNVSSDTESSCDISRVLQCYKRAPLPSWSRRR